MELIDKAAVVAEIERRANEYPCDNSEQDIGYHCALYEMQDFLNSLEVKEVSLDVMQRMEECPYRQVGCTMYADKILDCNGACSCVVDYPKVKELKAQKGE